MTQSTGHGLSSHTSCSLVAAQAFPTSLGAVTTTRVRVLVPLPHETEQADHRVKSPITQSTGHLANEQASCSVVAPHCFPPALGCTFVVLVLVLTPAPHVVLHALQTDQSDCSQLTMHGSTLHCLVSKVASQAFPPAIGRVTIVRVLV